MSRLIRIDMNKLEAKIVNTPTKFARLGGRALSSHIIATEVPPTSHPLSQYNKLIFSPGLLAGTAAPNSGRLSVGPKAL